MAEEAPFVSVIIPVYNDPEHLQIALDALERQTYPADRYEVIVVDNASDVAFDDVIGRFPHARLVHEAQRGSYAARNRGLEAAQGQYLAFIDSDCIPYPDWLEKGIEHLLQMDTCGLVGGRIEVFAQDAQSPTAAELFELLFAFQVKLYLERMHFAPTANLFTTRATFERVGLFDGSLQSNGDTEWGERVYAHDCRQIYAENVVVRHPARHTVDGLLNKHRRVVEGQSQRLRALGSVRKIVARPQFWLSILPPIPRIIRVLARNKWPLRQRVEVAGLLGQIYLIRLGERLRLLMPGSRL